MRCSLPLLAIQLVAPAAAQTATPLRTFMTKAGHLTSLAWSPDGKHIAAGTDLGLLHVWPADRSADPRVFPGEPGVQIGSLAWSPAGDQLKSVDHDDYIRTWNPKTAVVRRGTQAPSARAAWSDDLGRLAATYGKQRLGLE